MSFNGTGTFVINSSGQPAVTGAIITATAFNALTADLASGLSNCITRDGQGLPTGAINWNGQNLTGVNTLGMVTATISGNSTIGGTLGVTGTLTATGLVAAGSMTIAGAAVATQSYVTGLGYATLASPTFTGTPAAPTAAVGTKTTQIATTAFVRTPSIQSVASSATVTPTFADDQVNITAQAAALNLANPTGTAQDAWGIAIRIKDNGTARAITYGTQYRAVGVTLPSTTVINKTLYLGMVYNSADTKWDVVSVAQEA